MNASQGFTSYIRKTKQVEQSPYNNFIISDGDHMMVETSSGQYSF
jgi:hypothetical protein